MTVLMPHAAMVRRIMGLEAEQMSGSRVRVAQDIGRGEDVTGARIGRIGPP